MSRTDSDSTFRGLRQATNKRQAAKILDVSAPAALYLGWEAGREWWVSGTDGGLYGIGFGAAGSLYMARELEIGTVQANVRSADTVDVVHDPSLVPDRVYRGPGGRDG